MKNEENKNEGSDLIQNYPINSLTNALHLMKTQQYSDSSRYCPCAISVKY